MGVSRIRVHIDQVVFRGIPPADRKAVLEGLQSELWRMLAQPMAGMTLEHSYRTPVLKLGRMPLQPGPSGGRKFGVKLASAITKRLGS